MKITWLGHSAFRIEIGDQILLVDPWLTDNPMFPQDRRAEAIGGATHILVTHGHGDHADEVPAIAGELGIAAVAVVELAEYWAGTADIRTIPMGKGGTVALGDVKVSLVNAVHSSSLDNEAGPLLAGTEAGFMIAGEGHVIYVSGDTDIMADMGWMGEYYQPDIGILCCGGHYTMDQRAAAWAARKFFDFKTVIPCHYKTFGVLAKSADELVAALPDVDVRCPEVFEVIEI